MSVTVEECQQAARTLQSIKTCCTQPASKRDDRLGCINPPLLEVELDHVIVDELHLLLRITDRLISALVMRMAQLDHCSRVHQAGEEGHMKQLTEAVRSCGIHFRVKTCVNVKYTPLPVYTIILIGLAQPRY